MKKGFTIIELAISVFILSIAVVGIFNALSVIIILTSDSIDRLVATYLAQEGIEVVRSIRDTNWLNMDTCDAGGVLSNGSSCPASWVDGLVNQDAGALNNVVDCAINSCQADYTENSMRVAEEYLYLNSKNFYVHDLITPGNIPTKFKRKITIIPERNKFDDIANNILNVKVSTSWDRKATILSPGVTADLCCPGGNGCPATKISNCITVEETLYNWYAADSTASSNIPVQGISIDQQGPITLEIGQFIDLTMTIEPSNATNKNVTWGSYNNDIATVDPFGRVTAVSIGDVNIAVITEDGGFEGYVTVSVVYPP